MKKIMSLILIVTMIMISQITVNAEFVTGYVNTSKLNCRSAPNMNGHIITTYNKNTSLQIIGAYKNWLQVYDGTITGWCYKTYISTQDTTQTTTQNQIEVNNNSNIGKYLGTFTATYYTTSRSENGGYDTTATGHKLKDVVGICIAADPKVIPYYSKVYIEGIGYRTVLDCGGAIKNNKIDILVNTRADIPSIGKHQVKVYLVQ